MIHIVNNVNIIFPFHKYRSLHLNCDELLIYFSLNKRRKDFWRIEREKKKTDILCKYFCVDKALIFQSDFYWLCFKRKFTMRVVPYFNLHATGYFRKKSKNTNESTSLLLTVSDSRSTLSCSSSSNRSIKSYGSFLSIDGLKSLWNWRKKVDSDSYFFFRNYYFISNKLHIFNV